MSFRISIAVALLLTAASTMAHAQTLQERLSQGDAVVRSLNNGAPQPTLERMRQESRSLPMPPRPMRWAMSGRGRGSTTAPASLPPWRCSPPWASRPS